MEKAKFLFTAIAVTAIVSGAIAFKAKNQGVSYYRCDTRHSICSEVAEAPAYVTDNPAAPHITLTICGTFDANKTCSSNCDCGNVYYQQEE